MKKGLERRDDSLIAQELSEASERGRSLEQSGDLYAAWKEYRQGAETFAGLDDNALLRVRAEALEKDKAVREGAKREKQEFEEQDHLTNEISTGLSGLRDVPIGRAEASNDVAPKVLDLRNRAAHEKREEELRVLKRALAGVMVQAMEMGLDRLEQKDPVRAKEYFELACEADPDSAWAFSNLAVARAQDGDHKGALKALRLATAKTKDPEQFVNWLNEEPAFAKLRGTVEFHSLLQVPSQP
jgi:tetratricopeptide (TPR) repeat protein